MSIQVHRNFEFFTESKICEALDEDLHITLTQSFKEPICESSSGFKVSRFWKNEEHEGDKGI